MEQKPTEFRTGPTSDDKNTPVKREDTVTKPTPMARGQRSTFTCCRRLQDDGAPQVPKCHAASSAFVASRNHVKPERKLHCSMPKCTCDFKIRGCKVTGCETDLQEHYETAVEEHLYLVAKKATTAQSSIVKVETEHQNNHAEEMRLKIGLAKQEREMTSLKKLLDSDTRKALMLEKGLVNIENCLAEITASVNFLKSCYQECDTRRNKQLQTEQEATRRYDRRLADVESKCLVPDTTSEHDSIAERLDKQSRHLATFGIRMAEMNVDLLCLETANYSGVLIWKLCDYVRRKRDAASGENSISV